MKTIDYRRHFAILSVASIPLVFFDYLPLPEWTSRFIFLFGLIGALHALALVVSLNVRGRLFRRVAFVCIIAGLSVLAPLVGAALAGLASPLGDARFYLALVLGSAFGASTYWLLIRVSWIPTLSCRSLVLATILCALTSPIAFIFAAALTDFGSNIEGALGLISNMILHIAWWFAFSYSLYRGETTDQGANNSFESGALKTTRASS